MTDRPPTRRVRWTEHGPVPVDDVEPLDGAPLEQDAPAAIAESDTEDDDAAAVRARLEARGLLRTEPSVRIRDLAGPRPEPSPPPPTTLASTDVAVDDDAAEVLDADPGGATANVRCRSCRSVEPVSVAATGYRCRSCQRVWRWAICPSCDELAPTLARQESWRCSACGAGTRSWWRTANAPNEAVVVADRKRLEAGRVRRRRVLGTFRRYRVALAATTVTLVLVVFAAVAVPRLAADDRDAVRASATCAAFDTLRAEIEGGGLPPAALRLRLDELASGAAEAEDAVRIGAERLAASGLPGDAAFEEATAVLTAACGGAIRTG